MQEIAFIILLLLILAVFFGGCIKSSCNESAVFIGQTPQPLVSIPRLEAAERLRDAVWNFEQAPSAATLKNLAEQREAYDEASGTLTTIEAL